MSRRVPSTEFVAAARSYLGVPFRHQGRSRTGLDCVGLLVRACLDCRMRVADAPNYQREPDWRTMRQAVDGQAIALPRHTPWQAGLIAAFRGDGWIHLGLLTGPLSFIHACTGPGEGGRGVIEHRIDDQTWGLRLVRLWRHPEMEWSA